MWSRFRGRKSQVASATTDEQRNEHGPVIVTGDEKTVDETLSESKKNPTISTADNPTPKHAASTDSQSDDIEPAREKVFNPVDPTTDPDSEDPELKDIPIQVRQLVSLEDDPEALTITFRYFILCIIFISPGAFLSQMSTFRTTSAPYSVLFVQIACHYLGHWMAKVLPDRRISIPGTKYGFSLNPGPWSIKEHVLVTISAASGATSNMGSYPISLAPLYYNTDISPGVAIFFMFSIVWLGYSYAALARQFLIYDPQYIWPQALMQSTLFNSFKASSEDSRLARKRMKVFFFCLVGMIIWQFLPEYVFPFLSSLAFLCWVAPRNATANFIGGGLGGMGFLNLSLDWSNITSSIMLYPFWTQAVMFAGFVFSAWILLPAAKWGNLGTVETNDHLMSNSLYMANGTKYPTTSLITSDLTLNETALAEYGSPYLGTQYIWDLFFTYASYTSSFSWMLLFGWPSIKTSLARFRDRLKARGSLDAAHQYNDRLNIIQRAYKDVPFWWYIVLFGAQFVAMMAILGTGNMFIPIWTYIIAMLKGAIIVIPLGWLYAICNYQLEIGDFNELVFGYMVNAVTGHKHPAGASTYGAIAGDAWYRAQYMLQDQKIGHYMHIPPRLLFFSQIFGELIGVPINYGVIQWIIRTKRDYLLGTKTDPLHQWTGQTLSSYNSKGVQYVLIGPKRMFAQAIYNPLPWAFLLGFGLPFLIFALHRFFPRVRFDLWNVTIFCASVGTFYGNLSTGYASQFIGGFIVMYWAYRYRYELWKRYNYVIAAAFDAGYNFNMLLIFLMFGSGKQISMANWWGNNAESVERCFALD